LRQKKHWPPWANKRRSRCVVMRVNYCADDIVVLHCMSMYAAPSRIRAIRFNCARKPGMASRPFRF
jgi:hypothetical protein